MGCEPRSALSGTFQTETSALSSCMARNLRSKGEPGYSEASSARVNQRIQDAASCSSARERAATT